MTASCWAFSHPPKGTCVPGCPEYGWCHCLCGEATAIASQSRTRSGDVIHRPMVFRHGHQVRVLGTPGRLSYQRIGVPVARVAPLARWLKDVCGGLERASALSGVPRPTLSEVSRQRHDWVHPTTARGIVRAVQHLRHQRSPWRTPGVDVWDSEPVQPWERTEREAQTSFETRMYRKGLRRGIGGWVPKEKASA